ncbi:Uncharacterised protein [Vibrio cholerae]|nr:Uncharacterised protein [Vibrio cholerae]CSD41003.1 Uncharacterised protein [Vibrio cholerae]CSI53505.1 Uncharacterised protein [Vibrio cholerae]
MATVIHRVPIEPGIRAKSVFFQKTLRLCRFFDGGFGFLEQQWLITEYEVNRIERFVQ